MPVTGQGGGGGVLRAHSEQAVVAHASHGTGGIGVFSVHIQFKLL